MPTDVMDRPATGRQAGTDPFDFSRLIEPDLPDPLELFCSLPVGEAGERYDLELSPWARCVFDWWLDPEVTWIWLIQGSQTSKTTTMMGLLLYAARYDPGPGMWVAALEEEADKFSVLRLKPFLASADAQTRTGEKKDWRKMDLRIYGRMLLHLAYATSARKLRSWPCRYLFGDECGIWPVSLPEVGEPIEHVKKRTRRYRMNRKGIFATTPTSETHPSWQEATAANFYRWHVPCPECGGFQYLSFDRLRFGHCRGKEGETQRRRDAGTQERRDGEERPPRSGAACSLTKEDLTQSRKAAKRAADPQFPAPSPQSPGWDLERVAAETYYECEHCAAKVTDEAKADMIAAGKLVCVEPDTGRETVPQPGNLSRTLQVPATYSLFTAWGALAVSFLQAKAKGPDALRVFVTDELAEAWREPTEAPDRQVLFRCIDEERIMGRVPEDAIALTQGIDVQRDRVFYTVWSHQPEQRSALVAAGEVPIVDRDLSILDDLVARDYEGTPLSQTFVDSGDGEMTDNVYRFCRRYGPRIAPCKGIAAGRQAALVRPSPIDRDTRGRSVPAGLILYLVNSGYFRALVHARVRVNRGDPGEWRLPGDLPADFLDHVLAKQRIKTRQRGEIVEVWVNVRPDDHYLDATIYAFAAAWFPVRVHAHRPRLAAEKPIVTGSVTRSPVRREY